MKTLKNYFDNGELENLPSMVQEAANLEYSTHNRYFEAVDKKNRRIAECSGWFSDGLSDEELNRLNKITKAHVQNYLSENEVDLTMFNKSDRDLIKSYAMDVLIEILIQDKE